MSKVSVIECYDEAARGLYEISSSKKSTELTEPICRFTHYLKKGALIFDAGCGSGLHTKRFLSIGFDVLAMDISKEMCKFSEKLTGHPVHNLSFDEMDFEEQFDAVWSSFSLVHYSPNELEAIIPKFLKSIKVGGIWYMSFFYGVKEQREPIPLYWMTEKTLRKALAPFKNLQEEEWWSSSGQTMKDRKNKLLHYIVRKSH